MAKKVPFSKFLHAEMEKAGIHYQPQSALDDARLVIELHMEWLKKYEPSAVNTIAELDAALIALPVNVDEDT